jgi:hypothetical protein
VVLDEVFEGAFVAVLDEEEEGVGGFFGVDVFEDVGVGDFAEEVDLLEEGVGGYHGGVCGDLLHCEFCLFVALAGGVVPEVDLAHGPLAQHVAVFYLVLAEDQKLFFL